MSSRWSTKRPTVSRLSVVFSMRVERENQTAFSTDRVRPPHATLLPLVPAPGVGPHPSRRPPWRAPPPRACPRRPAPPGTTPHRRARTGRVAGAAGSGRMEPSRPATSFVMRSINMYCPRGGGETQRVRLHRATIVTPFADGRGAPCARSMSCGQVSIISLMASFGGR